MEPELHIDVTLIGYPGIFGYEYTTQPADSEGECNGRQGDDQIYSIGLPRPG